MCRCQHSGVKMQRWRTKEVAAAPASTLAIQVAVVRESDGVVVPSFTPASPTKHAHRKHKS